MGLCGARGQAVKPVTRRLLSCRHPGPASTSGAKPVVRKAQGGQPPAANKNEKCCVRPSCSAAICKTPGCSSTCRGKSNPFYRLGTSAPCSPQRHDASPAARATATYATHSMLTLPAQNCATIAPHRHSARCTLSCVPPSCGAQRPQSSSAPCPSPPLPLPRK